MRAKKYDFSEEIEETKSYFQGVHSTMRAALEKVYYAPGMVDKTLVIVDFAKEHKPLLISIVLVVTALSG
jgi:hypothetical protein